MIQVEIATFQNVAALEIFRFLGVQERIVLVHLFVVNLKRNARTADQYGVLMKMLSTFLHKHQQYVTLSDIMNGKFCIFEMMRVQRKRKYEWLIKKTGTWFGIVRAVIAVAEWILQFAKMIYRAV